MMESIEEIALKRSVEAVFKGGTVKLSANGEKLFSTCTNVVKCIDLKESENCYIIGDTDDELRITCTAVDKNRNRLLIAFDNQVIREFSIPLNASETPQLLKSWETMHTAPILVMEFNEDGHVLATGSTDHVVQIWNIVEAQCTRTLKGPSGVSSICFGKNEKLVVGYIEGQLNLYSLTNGVPVKLVMEWRDHSSHITKLLRVPDSRIVVALSRDKTMSLHDTETPETLKVLPLYESIESGAIGPNGSIFTVGEEGILKEWIMKTGRLVREKKIAAGRVEQLEYDDTSNQLLAVTADHNLVFVEFDFKIMAVHSLTEPANKHDLSGSSDADSSYGLVAVPYDEFDIMLTDIDENELERIGDAEGVKHLSPASYTGPSFPVRGILHGVYSRLMIPLIFQRFNRPDSPSIYVWCLLDTGSPFTCLTVRTLESFFGGGNVIDGSYYPFNIQKQARIECHVSRVGTHFEHVNILGIDALCKLKLSIDIDWTESSFTLIQK